MMLRFIVLMAALAVAFSGNCFTYNSNGELIDLSPMQSGSEESDYSFIDDTTGYKYDVNICAGVNTGFCDGVAGVCQYVPDVFWFNCGSAIPFTVVATDTGAAVEYSGGDQCYNGPRTTQVFVDCDPSAGRGISEPLLIRPLRPLGYKVRRLAWRSSRRTQRPEAHSLK